MVEEGDNTADDDLDASGATDDDTGGDNAAQGGAGADDSADQGADGDNTPDWRAELSGGDEKLMGYLSRYASPKAFVEAAKKDREQARQRANTRLPDNPTEDELAGWRKANGIPDKPEGYMESLPDGLAIGDNEKADVEKYIAKMHDLNATPNQVSAGLETFYAMAEEASAQAANFDAQQMSAATEELREEWKGPEYKRNLNIMHGYLDKQPAAIKNLFTFGRVPEFDANGEPTGRHIPIGYMPEALRWLTGLALEENPVATVVPGAGANQGAAIADEMAGLQKMMGDRNSDYWKGPKAAQLQARFRELATAQETLKARGG